MEKWAGLSLGLLLFSVSLIHFGEKKVESVEWVWPSAMELQQTRNISEAAFRTGSSSLISRVTEFEELAGAELLESGENLRFRVPKKVLSLHGTNTTISGYGFPLLQAKDGVEVMLLFSSREAMSCGLEPRLDRWICVVFQEPQQIDWAAKVSVRGRLDIGPSLIAGQLRCLYKISGAQAFQEVP